MSNGEDLASSNTESIHEEVQAHPSDASIEIEDDIDLDQASADEARALAVAHAAIVERCKAAKIEYEFHTFEDEIMLEVVLPAGRQKRSIYISSLENAAELLNLEFESYVFIGDYQAICIYDKEYIEIAVGTLGNASAWRLHSSLFGLHGEGEEPRESLALTQIVGDSRAKLSVTLHLNPKLFSRFFLRSNISPRMYMTIEGVDIKNNEKATRLIETIANSVFFEIDTRFNVPLTLIKARRTGTGSLGLVRRDVLTRKPLELPESHYDKQAISLYWYGRGANGLPLLRFGLLPID